MGYLVDTPEINRIINGLEEIDPLLQTIKRISQTGTLFISAVSHGEVAAQIGRIENKPLQIKAAQRYNRLVSHIGSKNILPFCSNAARSWAELASIVRPGTLDASAEEMLVAATACFYAYPLICSEKVWHKQLNGVIKFMYV